MDISDIFDKIKAGLSVILGIAITPILALPIGVFMYESCIRDNSDKQQITSYTYEPKCAVTHGEYDDFIKINNFIYPCPDSLGTQDSIDKKATGITSLENIRLWYRHENDSLLVQTSQILDVCYLVLHADINDTLDFKRSNYFEYVCRLGDHNISYSELEKINLVYGSTVESQESLTLSKKEFEETFKPLVPYLKLRKARKLVPPCGIEPQS